MTDLERLQQAVADLSRTVEALSARVSALERRGLRQAGEEAERWPEDERPHEAEAGREAAPDSPPILTLIGRTFLVLGGAYLLRAFTDYGTLPRAGGTALGLLYGVSWFVIAWRSGAGRRASRELNAAFHAAAAAMIAFPLLWETTIRVNLLSANLAASALGAVTAIGLLAAWHRRLRAVAWVTTVGGLLVALVFMASAAPPVPMALYLAALGVATLWLGYTRDWTWLRWPVAFTADLVVLGMVASAARVWHHDEMGGVMLVQVVLFAGYLLSIAVRTLYRSREVVPFEVCQTLALVTVGFGGAAYLMVTTGSSATPLGVAGLVFGAGSYGVAFAFGDWRHGHWKNFVFYASLATVFILAGTALTLGPSWQAIVWSSLALASALAGRRQPTIALGAHAAVYAVAAAHSSQLLGHATDGFVAAATGAWTPLVPAGVVALAASGLACAVPLAPLGGSRGGWPRLPKIVLAVLFLWSLGGTVVALLVPLVTLPPGAGADAAALATVRTAILGVSALVLGWSSRGLFAEGGWFMYGVLLAGALKLLVEDFPRGRPSTLFLALAVYGGALILGPRLAKGASKDSSAGAS